MRHPYLQGLAGLFIAALVMPVLASAQTSATSASDAQLIAQLEQLVATLQQELAQLIAMHHGSTPTPWAPPQSNPTPTPASPVAAPTCTMTTSPGFLLDTIGYSGTNLILHWSSTGATTGTITPDIGTVTPNGSQTVNPTQNTTWTGTFTGAGGVATCSTSYIDGGTISLTNSFNATPASGPAPLTVTFTGSVVGSGASIAFGDATPAAVIACSGGCGTTTIYTTHTYNALGFYVAYLRNGYGTTVGVETILVNAGTSTPVYTPPATSTAPLPASGSCVAYTTTYQNGATIWYIGKPGPGVGQVLGQVATQWTCDSGTWVSAANVPSAGGSPGNPPISGSSCTFIGSTYANGNSIQCTVNPSEGACPVGVPVSTWTCSNGQWVAAGPYAPTPIGGQ